MKSEGERFSRTEDLGLADALAVEGCPVCRISAGLDERFFFWFFHENYGTAETFDALARSFGFCARHGTLATRNPIAPGPLSVVYELLSRRTLHWLAGKPSRATRKGGRPSPSVPCPACRSHEEGVSRISFFLSELLESAAGRARYGHPAVLCFPHLQSLAPRLSDPALLHVVELQESAVQSALDRMDRHRPDLARPLPRSREGEDALAALVRVVAGRVDPPPWPLDPERPSGEREPRDPVADLLERISRQDACPVCLEVDRARSEWAGWLAEAASRGWEIEDVLPACPAHVAAVAGSNPFLGFAVSRKTLRTVQDRIALSRKTRDPSELRDAAPGDRPLRRILSSFRRRNRPPIRRDLLGSGIPCPVCKRLDLARDRALSLLFALLEARPHRRRYEGGYGLCFRHFLRALALHPPEHTRGILREVESAQLARLQWELEEFVRKEAWSNRPEAAGTECTAWRRAVERFSGRVTEGAG